MTDPGDTHITAEQVRGANLPTRRGGYDQAAVDDLLDEVAEQLGLPPGRRSLTAQSLLGRVFPSSGLRTGYQQQGVDDLLDAVHHRLTADEVAVTPREVAEQRPAEPSGGSAPAVPGGVDPSGPAALPDLSSGSEPDPGPTPSPVVEPTSWWRRLTGRRGRSD